MDTTKTKTTYGVYNLIEWHALLRMGKATIKVIFTGGSITTQGVTPATFTTDNPIIQFAIEKSPEFLNGKIKIVRRVKLKGAVEIERNAPKVTGGDSSKAAEQTAADQGAVAKESPKGESDENENNDESVNPADRPTEGDTPITQVEFSCNDDAKDYLEQTFGFVRSKLRNREDIVNAGKAHGVSIIFV